MALATWNGTGIPAALGAGTIASSNNTAVQCIDPTTDSTWDNCLANCAGATFFHTAAWARVLKSAYGFEPVYIALRKPSGIGSILPIMSIASKITGRRGVSLPFTDEVPPLATDQVEFDVLHQAAWDMARNRNWKYLELRGGRMFLADAIVNRSYWGHTIELNADPRELFARLAPSTRRAIRKAEHNGVEIRVATDMDSVQTFHRLLCQTRRRHGVPPQPISFFAALQQHVLGVGLGEVILAQHSGRPIAGAIFCRYGQKAIFKYGASDHRFQHLRASNLVMWKAITQFAAQRFSCVDLGRTDHDNEGLRRFKLSWGSVERSVDYTREVSPGCFATGRSRMSRNLAPFFRAMPMPLARLIGTLLYRHIA